MIDAFKIGAVLELKSNVAKSLTLIAEEFDALDRRVKSAQKLISEFVTDLEKISSVGRGAGQALNTFAEAAAKVGRGGAGAVRLAEGLERIESRARSLTGLREVAQSISLLSGEAKETSGLARALGRLEKVDLGKNVGTLDTYVSAVGRLANLEPPISRLAKSMMDLGRVKDAAGAMAVAGGTNAVERELAARARDRQMRAESLALQHDRRHEHDLGMASMVAGGAGHRTLDFLGEAVDRAFEMEHLRQQLLSDTRISGAMADSAVGTAFDASKSAPGTSPIENLRALIDLYNVTGDFDEAKQFTPAFARLTALLQLSDRRKGGAGDPAFAAAKAEELFGGMIKETTDASGHVTREVSGAQLLQHLEMIERVAVRTNMRVTPEDYLRIAKTGELPGMRWTDEFKYEQLPAIIMAMGASRAGTAFTSLSQVMVGGRLMDKYAGELAKVGLATPVVTKVVRDPVTGRRKKVTEGGVPYDLDLLLRNPLEYVAAAQVRMEGAGIHGTEAQLTAIERSAQRSTMGRLLADILKDMPAILKEQQGIRATGGRGGQSLFEHFAQNDPAAKIQQFHASFEKFLTVLGGSLMDPAIKVLDTTTTALNKLADWGREHPTMAKILSETAGGLGTLAVALGVLSAALWLYIPLFRLAKGALPAAAAVAGAGGATSTATSAALGISALAGVFGVGTTAAVIAASKQGYEMGRGHEEEASRGQNGYVIDPVTGAALRPFGPVAPTTSSRESSAGSKTDPIWVHVGNVGDLVTGVAGGISQKMNRPPSGVTSHDPTMDSLGAMYGGIP